ncbi:MAG: hypothetical protein OHK0039_39340 [Bacteroidia bacterium]
MYILPVDDAAADALFHKVPAQIYAGDPRWTPHLRSDVEAVFDRRRNPYFGHGDAQRWVLHDARNCLLGRIAAFYDTRQDGIGGTGFFECIDDPAAAALLFDTARDWLTAQGCRGMDGPVNFGERDRFWGLLVESSIDMPFQQVYHPAYYRALFEGYGFEPLFQQYFYRYMLRQPLPAVFQRLADRLVQQGGYHTRSLQGTSMAQSIDAFVEVYNQAWGAQPAHRQVDRAQISAIFRSLRPILDPATCWFAYHDTRPVAMLVMLPEINQIRRHLHSDQMGWWQQAQFLWHRWRGTCRRLIVLVMGIVPAYQRRGVESLLLTQAQARLQAQGRYDEVVAAWIGDFNAPMNGMMAKAGAVRVARATTYRKAW